MSDEDIQISRRKAETPLERFMLVIAQARAGTLGLHYCRDDDEINAAAQKGKKITNKLRVGDVIYCEFREVKGSWTITRNNDPFVAVVDGTGQGKRSRSTSSGVVGTTTALPGPRPRPSTSSTSSCGSGTGRRARDKTAAAARRQEGQEGLQGPEETLPVQPVHFQVAALAG